MVAQEEGNAAWVDTVTTQLCKRVMKDSHAMGVLSVAMNNTMGMAGMNTVFQGMMLMGGGPEGEAPPGGG